MVPHITVITPNSEKNVIRVATKQHKDKLYFARLLIRAPGLPSARALPRPARAPAARAANTFWYLVAFTAGGYRDQHRL